MKKFNLYFSIIFCLLFAVSADAQRPAEDCLTDIPPISVDVSPIIKHPPLDLPPPTLPAPPPPEEPVFDRMIFTLHGLGSEAAAWTRVQGAIQGGAPDFPARKAQVQMETYTQFSLENAGLELHNTFESYSNDEINPLNNFIIGHSQGGLAARACDRYERSIESKRQFNGIVTFATAHQGARLLNNHAMIGQLVDEGLIANASGPITQTIESSFFLDLFFDADTMLEYFEEVSDFFGNTLLPIVSTPANISNDYTVGALPLQELNASPSDVAKVAFYGVEDEPVAFRALSSFVNEPNNEPAFQANDDEMMVEVLNTNRDKFYMKYQWWNEMSSLHSGIWGWLFWADFYPNVNYGESLEITDAYFDGYRWWYTANDKFKFITGALSYEEAPAEIVCECEDPSSGYSFEYEGPCPSSSQGCTQYEVMTMTLVEKPSDGVVLAESAANYPGANYSRELTGSNHTQMRNDSNTKDALKKLLDGQYGLFFQTALQE